MTQHDVQTTSQDGGTIVPPPVIALTFDDGPNPPYTSQILATLRYYGVPATFFTIGLQVQKFPGLVWQAYNEGHALGNHTWDHPQLPLLAPAVIQQEITLTNEVMAQATGVRPWLMRPPYGETNALVRQQLAILGMTEALWTIDPEDWSMPGRDAIISNVLSNAQNGSIVLFHDGGGDRSQTVEALPIIIEALRSRGFRFVTIPQLFAGT